MLPIYATHLMLPHHHDPCMEVAPLPNKQIILQGNSCNGQVSTLCEVNKTIPVIERTISVKGNHLFAMFVEKQFQIHLIK